MARLNEPGVVTAEALETLRRKLLRQNRDLARVNSTQSLRIRQLENDCAAMLSENFDLRSHIVELQQEIDDQARAQQVAQHALDIKAQLEAQLSQWSRTLGQLGVQPPLHRPKLSKPSTGPRSRHRREYPESVHDDKEAQNGTVLDEQTLHEIAEDAEIRADEEGRLAPIMEDLPYPRNGQYPSENLMDIEVPESPRLDPRDVEEVENVKMANRTREPDTPLPDDFAFLDSRKAKRSKATKSEDADSTSVKSGTKRKHNADEPEVTQSKSQANTQKSQKPTVDPKTKSRDNKPMVQAIDPQNVDQSTDRKLEKLQDAPILVPSTPKPRKPLAVKNANEDLTSPVKKLTKEGKIPKVTSHLPPSTPIPKSQPPVRNRSKKARPITTIEPASTAPILVHEIVDLSTSNSIATTSSTSSSELSEVSSKETPAPTQEVVPSRAPKKRKVTDSRQTPMVDPISNIPSDIHVHSNDSLNTDLVVMDSDARPSFLDTSSESMEAGSETRPSRRARSSVSYAEPNLRAKMRRPNAKLVDAVTGEGRNSRRSLASSTEGGYRVSGDILSDTSLTGDDSSFFMDRPASLTMVPPISTSSITSATSVDSAVQSEADPYDIPVSVEDSAPPKASSGSHRKGGRTTSKRTSVAKQVAYLEEDDSAADNDDSDSDFQVGPAQKHRGRRRSAMV